MPDRAKYGLLGLTLLLGAHVVAGAQAGGGGNEDDATFALGAGKMVRGTVTAVAGDKIALKTEAGELYQVIVTPNTQLRHGREAARLTEVHPGDGIGAMGEVDAPKKMVHALFIGFVTAEQIRVAREAFGRTWISGTVTAIDELRLTVLRPDKVTQVIAVDEDTSFRRGTRGMRISAGGLAGWAPPPGLEEPGAGGGRGKGESITLGDVKVGNSIVGEGALKSGVFVPTQLAVVEPGLHGRRGAGGAGANLGAVVGK